MVTEELKKYTILNEGEDDDLFDDGEDEEDGDDDFDGGDEDPTM